MIERRKCFLDTELGPLTKLKRLKIMPQPLTLLTGDLKVLLPQSRTKDNVDHAGPSLSLELWRVATRLQLESLFLYLSKSSLIAIILDLQDAMVDPWQVASFG